MPALVPTDIIGTITWLGVVSEEREGIRSAARDSVDVSFAGVEGEIHGGRTRPSCSRGTQQHPRDTEIANVRQFAVVSAEELAQIAADLELDSIAPEWLGASIVIEGIPDFSHIPPSARLQTENGTTLVVDMQNRPCQFPAKEIEKEHKGHGKRFKPVAEGRRGVTAWVEREGSLSVGDKIRLHIPDQRGWQPDMTRPSQAAE